MTTEMISSIQALQRHAASLLLYQSVLEGEIGQAFLKLLQTLVEAANAPSGFQADSQNSLQVLQVYGCWFRALAIAKCSWPDYLCRQILQADNPFSRQVQQTDLSQMSPTLLAAAQHDLRSLRHLYTCEGQQIGQWVQAIANLSESPVIWSQHHLDSHAAIKDQLDTTEDWGMLVEALADHYRQAGTGIFAAYRAFRWQDNQIIGVAYPDPICLQDLTGYEWQKAALIKNTEALLAGYPALHVLLYGSRGSGKSSLIKGLLQTYGDRGLRLVEVTKTDLQYLPAIADRLRTVPLKFVIFVDDLSFEEDEDAYKALKVVLEGSVTARPQNIVVYATSNRRHLIREFFGDRPAPREGDEIHAWDTVQEKLSFSDRFGLTLTFEPADQTTYLAIVHHLAQQAAITLDREDLEFRALQWATRHNGRSGRTARQFIDFLQADLKFSDREQTSTAKQKF